MAEPETPVTPDPAPEKPAKTPRAKAAAKASESPGAGINASITDDPHGPRQKLDLDPDDPGINADVVS